MHTYCLFYKAGDVDASKKEGKNGSHTENAAHVVNKMAKGAVISSAFVRVEGCKNGKNNKRYNYSYKDHKHNACAIFH